MFSLKWELFFCIVEKTIKKTADVKVGAPNMGKIMPILIGVGVVIAIIIGGLFESTKYSLLLYIGGIVGFFIFIRLGNKYFEQSLKE